LRPGVAETAASLVDVAPTLAQLAGLGDLAGVDGLPLFDASGTAVADARIAVSELRASTRRPRLVAAQRFPDKVIRDVRSGADSYYDLSADPREQAPRSAAVARRAQPLVAALDLRYAASAGGEASGQKTSRPLAPAMENRLKALGYLD
jgi:arylsulfatase A-like enzyme